MQRCVDQLIVSCVHIQQMKSLPSEKNESKEVNQEIFVEDFGCKPQVMDGASDE